jgi:3-oxoacyl-ACP reductase-like protein
MELRQNICRDEHKQADAREAENGAEPRSYAPIAPAANETASARPTKSSHEASHICIVLNSSVKVHQLL